MSFYDELIACTPSRSAKDFRSIPIIRGVLCGGAASCGMYIDFLTQAYHHVKHTFPPLASAAARTTDASYQKALLCT